MDKVTWGMIGCGDVTEIKSGPAFNKSGASELVAVMARREEQVKDYALRHNIPAYYTDLEQFLQHPGLNAIYIATPPATHLHFAIEAFKCGKNVYVEKPMALNYEEARKMTESADTYKRKLVIAHYRRAQPMFTTIRNLLEQGEIGVPLTARLDFRRLPLGKADLQVSKTAWRVDPAISGGGLFHDMAPHQLGLLHYFFGEIESAKGFSAGKSAVYEADDVVTGIIKFKSGLQFNGSWNFSAFDEADELVIYGSKGSISFPVFDRQEINIKTGDRQETIAFDKLDHVQQPLIEKVVKYFTNQEPNPCPPEEGLAVMSIIDSFTRPLG